MLTASGMRPGTGFRPGTGIDVVNRPMTAVRGAGYTSQKPVFDPLNQGAIITSPTELQKDDSCDAYCVSVFMSFMYSISDQRKKYVLKN